MNPVRAARVAILASSSRRRDAVASTCGIWPCCRLIRAFNHAIENVTLQAGVFQHRHGKQLGAQLRTTLRRGSRDKTGLSGTLRAESAIGARDPWPHGTGIVADRHTPKPSRVADQTGATHRRHRVPIHGCSRQSRIRSLPGQQINVTALGGRTGVDGPDDRPPQELANGTNRAGLLSAGWRGDESLHAWCSRSR